MAFENTFAQEEYISAEPKPSPQYITAESGPAPIDLPQADTDQRAAKAHFALQDKSPGLESLQSAFSSGQEGDFRVGMAAQRDIENSQAAIDMVGKVAQTKGALTPEDVSFTLNTMKTKPVDPATVLENEYARKFVQFATTVTPDTNQVFSKAWEYAPGETAFEQAVGQNLIARKHLAVHLNQEIEKRWENTPWFDFTGNISLDSAKTPKGAAEAYALSLIPFVSWAQMHSKLKDIKTDSFLPGSNLAEQIQGLWLLHPDDFQKTLKAAVEDLWVKNPLMAITMSRAAVQFSNSDALLGNTFGIADIASVLPYGAIARFARGGIARGKDLLSKAPIATERASAVDPMATEVTGVTRGRGLKVSDEARHTTPEQVQLDLFHGDPRQGDLFAGSRPGEAATPASTAGLPPGKLRGTYESLAQQDAQAEARQGLPFRNPLTGKMEKAPNKQTQLELPLGQTERQADFIRDFEKYTNQVPKGRVEHETVVSQVQHAMADVVRASGEKALDVETSYSILGDIANAAKAGAARIMNDAQAVVVTTGRTALNALAKDLPSIFAPQGLAANPVALSREASQRLVSTMTARGEAFIQKLESGVGVERLSPEAQGRAYTIAERNLKNEFHSQSDYILDVARNVRDPMTGTTSVSIKLGDRGGQLFQSPEQANLFARDIFNLDGKAYDVRPGQQGVGFYVDVARPVDETASDVRDLLINNKSRNPSGRLSDLVFGTWTPRSAEDILSSFQNANRKVATFAPQELRKFLLGIADDISGLPRKSRFAVQDVLRMNRDFVDAAGQRGMFYKDVGEFETAFQTRHGRLPSEAETKAYFSYVQLSDMDWVLRNLGWVRDKERLGITNHRFTTNGGQTEWFEGKALKEFPASNPEDSGIYYVRDGVGTYYRRHDPELPPDLFRQVKDGEMKLIQIANPTDKPLKKFADVGDIINYVVTKDSEADRLGWKQATYRPGGHVIYPYDWFVKQPQVGVGRGGRNFYYGDTSIFNFSNEKKASEIAGRMDEARRMMNRNDPTLGDYVSKNLPFSENEFKKLFSDGYLHSEMPISHTFTGRTTLETDKEMARIFDQKGMKNDFQSSHNLYQFLDKHYLADRDMQLGTVTETGNTLKPWQIEEAPALDPFPALNRALGQGIRSRWMTDYKISAAENWVQQFAPFMNNKEEALRKNPLFTLYHPQWAEGSVDRATLMSAKNSQQAIIDFIGASSELQSNILRLEQNVVNLAYSAGGDKTADFVATHALPMVRDPATYLRSIAFHSKLGFFNPVQLLVQAQSLAHVIGVAGPVNGLAGSAAGFLMRRLVHTEEQAVIDRIAGIAKTFGWKEEHFIESYNALKSTGMWNVAGETAWRNDVFDPKIFQGTVGRFLDKGTFFFAEGERAVRMAAWNTAYREWRLANPAAELTNRITGEILNRADLLSVNMTRASNAAWQKGILSVPTQFFAFNSRLMEQFLGNRLTTVEKARAMGTYSLLYGVPIGLSTSMGFLPLYEDVKKEAMQRGMDLGDPFFKAFQEGLISTAVSAISGKDYNIAQRFGPGASNVIEDGLLKGKKSALSLSVGASGAVMGDIVKTAIPFVNYLSGVVQGKADQFPLLLEDFAAGAENISVLNNISKMLYGLNTGKYVSKNDRWIGKVTTMDSILIGTLGLTPQAISDAFLKNDIVKETKTFQDGQKPFIMKQLQRGMDEYWKGNKDEGEAFMKRASVAIQGAGFDPIQQSQLMQEAIRGAGTSMVDKLNYDFATKFSPVQQRQQRQDQFLKGK